MASSWMDLYGLDINCIYHANYLADLKFGTDFTYGPEFEGEYGMIISQCLDPVGLPLFARVVGTVHDVKMAPDGSIDALILYTPDVGFPTARSMYVRQNLTLVDAVAYTGNRSIQRNTVWTSLASSGSPRFGYTIVHVDGMVENFDVTTRSLEPMGSWTDGLQTEAPLLTGSYEPLERGSLVVCVVEPYKVDTPIVGGSYRRDARNINSRRLGITVSAQFVRGESNTKKTRSACACNGPKAQVIRGIGEDSGFALRRQLEIDESGDRQVAGRHGYQVDKTVADEIETFMRTGIFSNPNNEIFIARPATLSVGLHRRVKPENHKCTNPTPGLRSLTNNSRSVPGHQAAGKPSPLVFLPRVPVAGSKLSHREQASPSRRTFASPSDNVSAPHAGPSPSTFSAHSDNVSAVPSSLNDEVNIESDKATTTEAGESSQAPPVGMTELPPPMGPAPSTQSDTEFWPMSAEEIALFLAAYPPEGNALVNLGASFNSEVQFLDFGPTFGGLIPGATNYSSQSPSEFEFTQPASTTNDHSFQNSSAFTFAFAESAASTPDTSTESFVAPAAPHHHSDWVLPPVSTNSPSTAIEEPLDTVSGSSILPKKRRREEIDPADTVEFRSIRTSQEAPGSSRQSLSGKIVEICLKKPLFCVILGLKKPLSDKGHHVGHYRWDSFGALGACSFDTGWPVVPLSLQIVDEVQVGSAKSQKPI
ncbi:hypothetical protein B0H16DRAFT_1691935 [Mycena metata]|uniref:Uncharacterized protein n=1 Tax=Mycena metata TaxID=1033252 RepID=A0AAD7IUR1_9AGAR|nr:hypothetical protein B0H16DRAFT_1691935 [Mycena metata]